MNVRKKASSINIAGLSSGQSDRSVNKHSLGNNSSISSPRHSHRKVTDALSSPSRGSQFSPKKNVKPTFGKTNKKGTKFDDINKLISNALEGKVEIKQI